MIEAAFETAGRLFGLSFKSVDTRSIILMRAHGR